jgi:hypothetical protein
MLGDCPIFSTFFADSKVFLKGLGLEINFKKFEKIDRIARNKTTFSL